MAYAVSAMMMISWCAGSALSRRVSSRPSIRGSWRSIKIRRGINDSRTLSASSASIAVFTSYPSVARMTFANLRFCGLSSTMRIGSRAISTLWRRGGQWQQPPKLLNERARAALVLGHDAGDRGLEPAAVARIQILHGPDDDGNFATGGHRAKPRNEFETIHARHKQVHDHDPGRIGFRPPERILGIGAADQPVAHLA